VDRFEGASDDIFDLQDQVAASVVHAIAPKLERVEIERARRKPTESLDAYDYYLRARAVARRWTREANDEMLRLLYRAIELDSGFASAYGLAAWGYVQRKARGWTTHGPHEIDEAARLARLAVQLGRDDALALCWGGYAIAYILHDLDRGAKLIDRALRLNPNLATGWSCNGWVRVWLGEPEPAIQHLAHAERLSPLDSSNFVIQGAVAFAHFLAGRYDEASSAAEKSLRDQPDFIVVWAAAAAINALAGRIDEAKKAMGRLRELNPTLNTSNLADLTPFRRPEHFAMCQEALRIAGLPD
jgi:tetratricopeptide (TPR) repeat protein